MRFWRRPERTARRYSIICCIRRISGFSEAASRRLKVPMDKIPVNIERYGNTSAASIPILLDEMHRDGRLKRGDTLVMAGFGAGLTWGAALMTW